MNSDSKTIDKDAIGVYDFKGYALHWLQFRKPVLSEVLNSPDYQPTLHLAMDDLYLKAEKVLYLHPNIQNNKICSRLGINFKYGLSSHGIMKQPRPWHGFHGSMDNNIKTGSMSTTNLCILKRFFVYDQT